MKNYIIVTEGMTDSGLIESILEKGLNFRPYNNKSELNDLLKSMIGTYPSLNGELRRQPSPMFYHKDDVNVAIILASGCTNITATILRYLEYVILYDNIEFNGFLIITDTDKNTKDELKQTFINEFKERNVELLPDKIINKDIAYPCLFHFVPNSGEGAIEKILLQCSEKIFDDIFMVSEQTREILNQSEFEIYRNDWATDEIIQSFYMDKMQFGIISSILKPDKPCRIFIKDKLVRKSHIDKLCEIEEFMYIYNFLRDNLK